MTDSRIQDRRLDSFWQDSLNAMMEKTFPDVIGDGILVQSWKRDGWNDGTTTLFGVYLYRDLYIMCVFPDYQEPYSRTVKPRFEHTGWVDVSDD